MSEVQEYLAHRNNVNSVIAAKLQFTVMALIAFSLTFIVEFWFWAAVAFLLFCVTGIDAGLYSRAMNQNGLARTIYSKLTGEPVYPPLEAWENKLDREGDFVEFDGYEYYPDEQ